MKVSMVGSSPSFLLYVGVLLAWLLSSSSYASAQIPPGVEIPDDDGLLPEVIVDGFVDVEACYDSLAIADEDDDDEISLDEYVKFIQWYGPDGFVADAKGFSDLPLVLTSNFNILSCLCKREGIDDNCCIGQDVHLEAAGSKPSQRPNTDQTSYLFLVCSLSSIAIDRVLDSSPPSASPTFFPSATPTDIPSGTPTNYPTTTPSVGPTGPTNPPAVDMVVTATYQIGVFDGDDGDPRFSDYEADLVAAMNSLSADVLTDLNTRRQRKHQRQLLRSRDLQTVDIPTSVNGFFEINCPAQLTTQGDRCEEITASIVLLFQPNDVDPEGTAQEFRTALDQAIDDFELQDALDNANPDSVVYILTGRQPGNKPRGGVLPTDTGISPRGRTGIIIGAFAFVGFMIALLLARRRNDEKKEEELEPAPLNARLDEEPGAVQAPRKLAYDTKPVDTKQHHDPKPLVGATAPDYGKRQMPDYGKQMAESDDEMDNMSDPAEAHDSSSNAGSSGWSSSAGVSSLNTGSADGLDDIVGIAAGSTLAGLAVGSGQLRSGANDGSDPSIPSVSRTDLDSAIEAGDWAAVGATAALLAAASDSQSYSSKSQRTGATGATPSKSGSSVSSLDAARAAELDHLVDAGDWEGVVLAAAKYEAAEGTTGSRSGSVATDSDNRSGSITGSGASGTYPSVDSRSSTRSKAMKRQELRAQVEELVQRVVPEEINNVDEMMLQFRGREEELVETLRTMQERAVAQKARQGAQKAAKQQAKRSVSEARAAGVAPASTGPSTPSKADAKGAAGKQDGSPDSDKSGGSFPHVTATSLGTGQVTKKKPPAVGSEREKKQSALEQAIEAGDWEAVGEAAAMLSDASMTSADTDEIDRLAEGLPSDRSSAGTSKEGDRAAELDDLIDKGDWTGVVAAASRYSSDDKQGGDVPDASGGKGWLGGKQAAKEQEVEERRQRRLKRMQEEQEALAQAEIWMAIAEQSKQDTEKEVPGASDAADWAIARSLTMLAQAEQAGDLEPGVGSSQSQRKQQGEQGDGEGEV